MTKSKKILSISDPVGMTAVALLDFAGCFFMVLSSPPLPLLIIMVSSEVLLIALAIQRWVLYFRGYIAQQIQERLTDFQNKA